MIETLPKTRAPFPARPIAPQGSRDTGKIHQEVGHGQLDDETRRDLRRRKLCFTCQMSWHRGTSALRARPITLRCTQIASPRTILSMGWMEEMEDPSPQEVDHH